MMRANRIPSFSILVRIGRKQVTIFTIIFVKCFYFVQSISDANNLYGNALSHPLPQQNFKWLEDAGTRRRLIDMLPHMRVNGSRGFVAEVDLEIPQHLHDLLDDLPLAPEKGKVGADQFTPYMDELLGDHRYVPTEKLLLSHLPKKNYVIHCALLQFYMRMGALVTEVHKVITFDQSPFFQKYIDFK